MSCWFSTNVLPCVQWDLQLMTAMKPKNVLRTRSAVSASCCMWGGRPPIDWRHLRRLLLVNTALMSRSRTTPASKLSAPRVSTSSPSSAATAGVAHQLSILRSLTGATGLITKRPLRAFTSIDACWPMLPTQHPGCDTQLPGTAYRDAGDITALFVFTEQGLTCLIGRLCAQNVRQLACAC